MDDARGGQLSVPVAERGQREGAQKQRLTLQGRWTDDCEPSAIGRTPASEIPLRGIYVHNHTNELQSGG